MFKLKHLETLPAKSLHVLDGFPIPPQGPRHIGPGTHQQRDQLGVLAAQGLVFW